MARATAMRSVAESMRMSLAIAAATETARGVSDTSRPELVTTVVIAVLDVALDALRVPALIVDRRGEVVSSNTAARALMGGGRQIVRWSPRPANNSRGASATWEVEPLAGAGLPGWSFVIWRTPEAPSSYRRSNLSARQTETLGVRLGTVEFQISAIFDKVGVSDRTGLIATLMRG